MPCCVLFGNLSLSVADCEGLFAGQNATTGHLSKLQLHYTVAAKTYTYTYTIQYFTCNVESEFQCEKVGVLLSYVFFYFVSHAA